MGEKKQKGPEGEQKKKKGSNEAPKSSVTIVLKVEMHCEGCASNIVNWVKAFQGVESVKAEWEANKLTVTGRVDPAKTRDKLADKTKKKVELVSPKDDAAKGSDKKATDDKKPKEPQVMTVVLKMSLHCQGCIQKIHRILSKTKGVEEKCIDRQKELITVKGIMDGNALAETLKKNLKRAVEIVPQKKEGGGDKKKEGEGNKDKDKDKEKEGKKGKAKEEKGLLKMEENKMAASLSLPLPLPPPVFGYIPTVVDGHGYGYGYGYGQAYPNTASYSYPQTVYGSVYPVPDQQMFSDENPNAYCTVM